jgi:uncharacterized membrane protein YtjA (UPF0391 family)
MRGWTAAFFVLAMVTGAAAFGGIAGKGAETAKVLFFICLIPLIGFAIALTVRGRPPL